MKLISRIVLAAFLAGSLTACGGFSSGLPKDKQLDALTAAEATQFCEKVEEYYEKKIDEEKFEQVVCYLFAVEFAEWMNPDDLSAGCQTFYDDCMNPDEEEEEASCADAEIPACTATVAEYELCIEESVEAWIVFIQDADSAFSYACDASSWDSEIQWMEANEYDDPQSCKDFEATCAAVE